MPLIAQWDTKPSLGTAVLVEFTDRAAPQSDDEVPVVTPTPSTQRGRADREYMCGTFTPDVPLKRGPRPPDAPEVRLLRNSRHRPTQVVRIPKTLSIETGGLVDGGRADWLEKSPWEDKDWNLVGDFDLQRCSGYFKPREITSGTCEESLRGLGGVISCC